MDRNEWQPIGTDVVSRKELKPYMVRNNVYGLVYFSLHVGLAVAGAVILWQTAFSWWTVPLLLFHGAVLAFLFAPLHECIHSSAFKTRVLNVIVGRICGLIIIRPFLYSKYRHMAHHTFTQHPKGDPDRVPFPRSIMEYVGHISGFNIWHRLISNLYLISLGRFRDEEREFVPRNELRAVSNEARFMVLIYLGIAIASVWFQSWMAFYVWVLPRVLGEPALRAFRMIEHTGMAESPNMLENTRTTRTNFLVRFLYWNMPYHVEHHLYPSVPFHALKRLHEEKVQNHVAEVAPGVLAAHFKILKGILAGRASGSERLA